MKIDLQDGFYNDTVVIMANGKEVFKRENVNTRFQIGYALSAEAEIPEDSSRIRIDVPSKNVSHTMRTQIPVPQFLGVSLTPEGELDCRFSDEPFNYV